ncbi:hypothetical protein OSB04_000059 [Centaurea solstitialis]|uniref:Protein Lines C-terminal domain-containing protein n=1 Tax=Centaurea solstitialis TaxID=347529 RepID=A0AA38TVT9_9ASTR|nr:hypothetical protein OSB04_000059 [Centaurea solstitialis]
MGRREYSRLCYLIDDSLHLFTAKSSDSITKEDEKSLLIVLSQVVNRQFIVLNQIKRWIDELDSDSGSGFDSDNGDHGSPMIDVSRNGELVTRGSICHSSISECMYKVTNDLVFLLAVESSFVRHLAGNVLVAISEFVVASESYWEEFLQSLFFFFELIIRKAVSPSFDPPKRTKHLDYDSSALKLDLESLSSNAGWHSAGSIVLVLRNILKQQKDEEDDESLEIYVNALGSCLRNIPWDFVDNVDEVSIGFYGHLVQLFCSVVSRVSLSEAMADSVGEDGAIQEIFNVFPKILAWCVGKSTDCRNYMGISQYIRHKILVLMIKLSSLIHLDCKTIVSWLHLIDKYFQDPLFESIMQPHSDEDDCLQDSPFLPSLDNDVEHEGGSHRHLKRRVVFLYLKCAFSLIGLKERHEKQCFCGDVKTCSKKGLEAIYEWIEKQLHGDIFVKSELYDDRCKRFTKSFLQLYMHEVVLIFCKLASKLASYIYRCTGLVWSAYRQDWMGANEDDMLFEVLLQLTDMQFGCKQRISGEWTSEVVEKNVLLLLSNIFDPVHLFHLFLSELHYDHQVLLDYLISKDTGVSCAEYLLKCLRIVCDKWNSFVGFRVPKEGENRSSFKRRKVMNDSCVQNESCSESSSDDIPLSSKPDCMNQETCKQQFRAARDCLLLLKKSVESLRRKNLFPYNPEVLLRRCVYNLDSRFIYSTYKKDLKKGLFRCIWYTDGTV